LRYAILFSGMTEPRSLNGLEFCYRILTERFAFPADCIYVLTYDGTLRTTATEPSVQAPEPVWPGDGTKHRLRVNGEGNRQALRQVLHALRDKVTEGDLLFVNTTGHGGNYGDGRGPFLTTYPRRVRYWLSDFCSDLSELPRHESLVVLMAQCFSGGSAEALLSSSQATRTFVAAASDRYSYAMEEDLNWDSFQRSWVAAIGGRDVDGTPVTPPEAAAPHEGVTVAEAFHYAAVGPGRNPLDAPTCLARPQAAGGIRLLPGNT